MEQKNKCEREKWELESYDWGEIGRLKKKYRNTLAIDSKKESQIKPEEEGYWVFGSFAEDCSLAKIENFEFKYWEFKKGQEHFHEPKFQILATEYNFILEGKIKGRVKDKKPIELKAGDYIIVKPGEIVNLQQEILEDVKGITIKIPSRHGDTIKKSFIEKLLNFEK